MSEKTVLWEALGKTDPAHTKQFKRSGGFSGTALKPQWVIKKLTEQFGPCGSGWGMGKPDFQVVNGENREVLVYCTVSGWYLEGTSSKEVWGVGGDKIVSYIKANDQYKRPERWESDDEAFKKAYTDALMNAFKFVGVGADIHMGQFDDNKYVQEVAQEFNEERKIAEAEKEPRKPVTINKTQLGKIQAEVDRTGTDPQNICKGYGVNSIAELSASQFAEAMAILRQRPSTKAASEQELNDSLPEFEGGKE